MVSGRLVRMAIRLVAYLCALEGIFWFASWWFQIAPPVVADTSKGWRMAVGCKLPLTNEEGPYLLDVSSEGRRDRYRWSQQNRVARRVLVLGGSNAVGVSVPMDDVFTQVLDRLTTDTEVINLGCVLYELDQQVVLMREQLDRWSADIVLHCVNDNTFRYIFRDYEPRIGIPRCWVEWKPESPRGFELHSPEFPWWQSLTRHSALVSTFDLLLYRRAHVQADPMDQRSMTRDEERVARALVLDARDAAESSGARYIAFTASAPRDDLRMMRQLLGELSREGKIAYLDLADLFRSEGADSGDPPMTLIEDQGHWSVYGHFRVAEALAKRLDWNRSAPSRGRKG